MSLLQGLKLVEFLVKLLPFEYSLGDYGQAWRLWPSLATFAKLGNFSQAWRRWPSLVTMVKIVDYGQAWST
ncbi:hypothetical protein SFRURICE_004114 [Spodoptera frugiperda]|nr:hypothetical protein SFRURICE_004114 [Spodoptera frugiperda]